MPPIPVPRHPAIFGLLLWLGLLGLYTRGNDFPFYYHTDEPSKVEQVLAGERNFFHPQLLLLASETALRASGAERTPQNCAVAGRWASAAFAAGAAVLLAALAWRLGGPAAGAAAALLVGLNPLLFELAHYMKEDCAWLFGLSVTLLAAYGLERRRTVNAAALLGAAAGLATSGKYIGITALAAAAAFIALLPQTPARGRLLLAMLGGFALSFAIVNWLVILHPLEAWNGLRAEMGRMREVAEGQPTRVQWSVMNKMLKLTWPSPLVAALGFAGYLAWRTMRGKDERRAIEWLCVIFAAAFLALLLVTPRVKERYLLPTVELTAVLGAVGIARLGDWIAPRGGRTAAAGTMAAAVLLCAGFQLRDLAACWRDIHLDYRRELCAFLRKEVPADALIAHDWRVALTRGRQAALSPDYAFPQPTVESVRFLADLGTLDDFQRWGVRYFVITNEDYGNILNAPDMPANADLKARCRTFYGGLSEHGKLLWSRPRGRLPYICPDLSVYEVKAEGGSGKAEGENP